MKSCMCVCVSSPKAKVQRKKFTVVNVRFTANAYYDYGTSLLSQ